MAVMELRDDVEVEGPGLVIVTGGCDGLEVEGPATGCCVDGGVLARGSMCTSMSWRGMSASTPANGSVPSNI